MNCLFLHCTTDDIEQVLPLALKHGLGIELTSFCDTPQLEHSDELVEKHRLWLNGFNGMRTVHGTFWDLAPGAIDPWIREATATRIRQSISFARELDAQNLIIHNGYYFYSRFDAPWVARAAEFWQKILNEVPDGLTIHLENAYEITPDIQVALVDEVNDPRLGICLDIGHAHALSQMTVVDWITTLGKRITYVHLHDNDGSGDQHLPLGEGTIPLAEVLTALNTYAPQATWMIETEAVQSLKWLVEHGFWAYS